jgi:hypothetical protein
MAAARTPTSVRWNIQFLRPRTGARNRNHHEKLELMKISLHVLEQRIRLGDLALRGLYQAESYSLFSALCASFKLPLGPRP